MSDAPSYLMEWEAAELLRQKTGLRLWTNSFTTHVLVDCQAERDYVCVLHGPYWDETEYGKPDRDTRVFVCYRRLEGHISLQVLTQDADDDAFLNRDVITKFNIGLVTI